MLQAALIIAVATLVLGYPALGGGFLVNPHSDQYLAGYPFRQFAAAMLHQTGHFPLWNPYVMGGVPFVDAMAGDIFYPTFLLRAVMPTDVAMTWSFIIHVFLCGLLTFGFLRAARLGFGGALLGGLAYCMAGPVAGLVSPGHDGKLYVSAMLPAMLWLLILGIRDGRRWAWGALAIVVGLAVLSPHPQLLQYMLLAGGAYALFLAFGSAPEDRPERAVALRRLALGLGAVVLGGLMGAIQFLPVRAYVAWSPRAGGAGWEHAISYSMPPEELINTYLPQFSGLLDRYWGRNGIHFHSEYLGAAALVLFGLAFLTRLPGRRRFLWFWLGTLIVTALWALGGYTPFYHLVYALVPGTKYFRAPSNILTIVGFSVGVIVALGAEVALAGGYGRRYVIGWLAGGLVVALLASIGGFTNLGLAIAQPGLADLVEANAGAVVVGAWRAMFFVGLTCIALALFSQGRIRRGALLWSLVAITIADFWTILRHYWMFSPPASVVYAADTTVRYLEHLDQPARVMTLSRTGRDALLGGNELMLYRVRSTLGYHGNELRNYRMLMGTEVDSVPPVLNQNVWALTNTQYLLTDIDSFPVAGLSRVAGPARDAAGNTVSLYRLPGDEPYAWVAPVKVKAPDEPVLATVLNRRFDIRTAALFDTAAPVQGQRVTTLPAPLALAVRTTRYEPGKIDLALDAPAPAGSALIVSENYYPGWRATVDGRDNPIGRADVTLIGVPLPTGARKVELRFTDGAYESGKVVTLVAVGVALLLAVAGLAVDRRKA
jgi:hypothetical protein